MGARSTCALGTHAYGTRIVRIDWPRLAARALFDRDDRTAVHADHRLSASLVAADRVDAHWHADRRRGEIEGRLRQVPREAARRHRHERQGRTAGHRLSTRGEATDRRGAEETGECYRPGRPVRRERAEIVLG